VNFAQGALTATSGDLDIAIEGRGYFEVTLPAGNPAYTRDGSLYRTGDGLIVTSDGYEVAPGITIPRMHARSPSTPMGRSTPASSTASKPSFWAGSPLSASRTTRGWRPSARTYSSKPRHPGRHSPPIPAPTGSAR
jgi:flagellar hook-basal body protein